MLNRLIAAAAISALPLAAAAEPRTFTLDPEHTVVVFMVEHIGFSNVLVNFREIGGTFTYDSETNALSDVKVTIQADSVESFNKARDNHIRSKDFLNADEFPEIVFTAAGGTVATETSGVVEGELTLLGQTHPVTLDVTLNKAEDYPFGHQKFTLGISARASVNRSQWGMTYGVDNGLVGDRVDVIIETEALAD